jgi:hypothetical protein
VSRFLSNVINPLISTSTFAVILLLSTTATEKAFAQTVGLTPTPIAEHNALVADWQAKRDALNAAIAKQAEYEKQTTSLLEQADAQQSKVEAAKKGLSSAVLTVAETKKRLSKVDRSDADPKGEALSADLLKSQSELNTVITSSETLQADIKSMKGQHEQLRSTSGQLKNAAAAAKAAVSAAEVLVEAVKSAQLAISEGEGGTATDLETDFFKDAVSQAENARKSEKAARAALAETRKRQITIGERLLKADEQLVAAKQAETNAYEKFAAADAAFKDYKAKRKVEIDAKNALIAEIEGELNFAQEQLEAQQAILQNESLKMQDFTELKATSADTLSDLTSEVSAAKSTFDRSQATLRADQQKRAVASAAIIAKLNAEMRTLLAPSAPSADTTTATDRVLIPASELFAKNSAKLRKTDGVKLSEIASILKDTTSRVPEGIEWMVRVDSYGTGNSEEAWFISQNRALSVARLIIGNGKFTGTQVSANGLINAQPFSDATESGWIEIVLTAK